MRDRMIKAIRTRHLVEVTFDSYEKGRITRRCVPFDIGPSRREKSGKEKYHFWDLDSPDRQHNLSINPEQIVNLEILDKTFSPGDYISWTPNWFVTRDWGVYS